MQRVTRSSTWTLSNIYNVTESLPSRAPIGRSKVNFRRSSTIGGSLAHLVSFPRKTVPSVASSHLPSTIDVGAGVETADAGMQVIEPLKTVRVKFQMQKKCRFGEHFFLVGDNQVLGSWDPSNAIPLTWSVGHVWAVEMHVPVGTSIQFKFILKGKTGEISWQPGPDRIFKTWDTTSAVTVMEDWDNAKLQKITEDPATDLSKEMTINPESEMDLKDTMTDPLEMDMSVNANTSEELDEADQDMPEITF